MVYKIFVLGFKSHEGFDIWCRHFMKFLFIFIQVQKAVEKGNDIFYVSNNLNTKETTYFGTDLGKKFLDSKRELLLEFYKFCVGMSLVLIWFLIIHLFHLVNVISILCINTLFYKGPLDGPIWACRVSVTYI